MTDLLTVTQQRREEKPKLMADIYLSFDIHCEDTKQRSETEKSYGLKIIDLLFTWIKKPKESKSASS